MNKWQIFIAYAKEYPDKIPKNMKERSKLYHAFLDNCKCGSDDNVCKIMGVPKIGMKSKYSASTDPYMLKAKIKAYEEIVEAKDIELKDLYKEIDELYKHINKLEKKKAIKSA